MSHSLRAASAALVASLALTTASGVARAEDGPACVEPVASTQLRAELQRLREDIPLDPLASRDALAALHRAMPCVDDLVDPSTLAELWYLRGVAEVFALKDQGKLDAAGREQARAFFRHALALDGMKRWDSSSYGALGQDLFDDAMQRASAPGNAVLLIPSGAQGVVAWDGQIVEPGEHPTWHGTHLWQQREGTRTTAGWLEVAAGERAEPPVSAPAPVVQVPPPDDAEDAHEEDPVPPPTARAVGARLLAQTWAFPMAFAGPEASMRVKLGARPWAEVGGGAAWGPVWACGACAEADGISLLFPIRLEGGLNVLDAHAGEIDVGLGWQAIVGGRFGTAGEVDAGTASRHAGGPVGSLSLRREIGGLSVEGRVAGGWVLAPASFQGLQGTVGVGIGRAVAK